MVLWVMNILMAILILAIPLYMILRPPKHQNHWYGYRTSATLKDSKKWKVGNYWYPRFLLRLSLGIIAIQIATHLLFGVIISIFTTCVLWVIGLLFSIVLTERKIKAS